MVGILETLCRRQGFLRSHLLWDQCPAQPASSSQSVASQTAIDIHLMDSNRTRVDLCRPAEDHSCPKSNQQSSSVAESKVICTCVVYELQPATGQGAKEFLY